MAAQGERGQEGIDIVLIESMAQDEITMQDTVMQVELSPQPNPESEMGAAAFDTPTPPPILAREISTIRGEVNKLKGSVEGVWAAVKESKEDMTNKIITVGQEVDKLGQGMKKVKEGQDQLRRETKKELEAVKKSAKRDTKR